MRPLTTAVLVLVGSMILGSPSAGAQTVSLPLPELEGAYGGFAGVTLSTAFDFGQSFPGISSARLDLTGYVSLPFPVDVGFQVRLDGSFGPVQIETGLSDFQVSVVVEPLDSVFDGKGTIELGAFVQYCCDHQAFITSATLHLTIEPFESVELTPTTLTWAPMSYTADYDVVSGDLTPLVTSGGDFSQATTRCVAVDQSATSEPFVDTPEPGAGMWVLVRGGSGSYDSGATSQAGLRDAEIRLSLSGCP